MGSALCENRTVEAEVTAVTGEGSGISRVGGMVLMTPGALPGDRCRILVEKVGKSFSYGRLLEVTSPSPDRTEPSCPAFSECGGCAFQDLSYGAECRIKEGWVRDSIRRIGGFDTEVLPIIPSVSERGYRNKAIYQAGKGPDGRTVFGFYKRKTHEVTDASGCILQPEEFRGILDAVRFYADENKISVYDERTGKGLLRAVFIRKAAETGETGVCLVLNGSRLPESGLLVSLLTGRFPDIVSVMINENRERTNVVLGKRFISLWGKDRITDVLCGRTFDISPASFYQVNHDTAQVLYGKVREYAGLGESDTLLDIYCGAGTIGLSVIGDRGRLIGAEIVPEAVANAVANAERNGVRNAEFICADAEIAAKSLSERGLKANVVVVDPPRKGCSEKTLECICRMSPQKIVYVSCGHATLARDMKYLGEKGYEPKRIQPVDMFPRTCHVETVCLLSKKNI